SERRSTPSPALVSPEMYTRAGSEGATSSDRPAEMSSGGSSSAADQLCPPSSERRSLVMKPVFASNAPSSARTTPGVDTSRVMSKIESPPSPPSEMGQPQAERSERTSAVSVRTSSAPSSKNSSTGSSPKYAPVAASQT